MRLSYADRRAPRLPRFAAYRSSNDRALSPAINFSRFLRCTFSFLTRCRSVVYSSDYLAGRRELKNLRPQRKQPGRNAKGEARATNARLSKFRKKHLPFPCISRLAAAPTLHRTLFNGRFFALFGRLINRGASRLYFAPVLRLHRRTVARCSGGRDAGERGERGGASPGG